VGKRLARQILPPKRHQRTITKSPSPLAMSGVFAASGTPDADRGVRIDTTVPESSGLRTHRAHIVACALVVLVTAVYFGALMLKDWIPFDEGTLGQSAHRVLIGQLPHRDFDELYTGGLSFANATAFRVLGENLVSLRLVLFGAILLVMPACYYIASRFTAPLTAAALSVGALMSSFPTYPAAMPSWYSLIFALFGCAALLRYLDVGKRRWILAAGLCGGLSVLVKIVGVYFIAAGALFLIFNAYASPQSSRLVNPESLLPQVLVLAVLAAIASAPFAIMRGRLQLDEIVELGLPILAICITVGLEVLKASRSDFHTRLMKLISIGWPFACGVLIPLVCFVVPYVRDGALLSLYHGVFVLPQKRLQSAAIDGPPLLTLLLGLPPVYLVCAARFSARGLRMFDAFLVIVLEAVLVVWSAFSLAVTVSLWAALKMANPLLAIAGAAVLAIRSGVNPIRPLRRQQFLLLVSTNAWCAFSQFPVNTYAYFLYVVPFFLLTAGALATIRETSRKILLPTTCAFLVLALLYPPVFLAAGDSTPSGRGRSMAKLDLARGGLVIPRRDRDHYVSLVSIIQRHSASSFIYVTPDAPEVYFLASRENPTRTLFDLFDDPRDRTNRVLTAIRTHNVDVVVINRRPRFSSKIAPALNDSLTRSFPEVADVGQFQVRWRPR
jgi:hypothetical protein